MAIPSHSAQEREAAGRAPSSGDPTFDAEESAQLNADAVDVTGDPVTPEAQPKPAPRAAEPAPPAPKPEPRRGSPGDDKRAEMAKRLSAERTQDSDTAAQENAELQQILGSDARLPAELRPTPEPEPGSEPETPVAAEPAAKEIEPEPDKPPEKFKLVIRGKEVELTEDEIRAAAQRGLAGDNYFDEAKAKAQEASEFLRTAQQQAQRSGHKPEGEHPVLPTDAQTAEQPPQPGAEGEHPANPFVSLVEKLQFGAPDEAAAELQTAINKAVQVTAAEESKKVVANERLRDEIARSQKALQDFQEKRPDLQGDFLAQAAIERKIYDLYSDDLKQLGVKEDQLPKDPGLLAQWHSWYRANGFRVQRFGEVLEKAADEFTKWKGVPDKKDEPAATQKGPPRVEVVVDRTARRAAIPQQPTRSAAPKQDAQAPAPPRDRSDIVQEMIAKRRGPRSW